MENRPTFAQLDALKAEREAKKRELVERFSRVLSREFSFNELVFLHSHECEPVRVEAYELARNATKAR